MSNKYTFTGRVVSVGKTEKFGREDKPFYKRVIVVDDSDMDSKYPNPVPFEATGDKCQDLDGYKEGDEVRVEFYPNGRAWDDPKTGKTRYFASNRIASIEADGGKEEGEPQDAEEPTDEAVDDMPF